MVSLPFFDMFDLLMAIFSIGFLYLFVRLILAIIHWLDRH